MSYDDLIQKAIEQVAAEAEQTKQPFFQKTIAWFGYLGILRHNTIEPQRQKVSLDEVMQAGVFEPRILELLPAVLIMLPEAIQYEAVDIPRDLSKILSDVRLRRAKTVFRGIPPDKYLHWLKAPIMDVARRRINYRTKPRKRRAKTSAIGQVIRDGRLMLALTQRSFAERYKLSLRVIRDLEQGRMDASLKSVNAILRVLGRELSA